MRTFAVAHLQMLSLSPPAFIAAARRTGYDAIGLRLEPVTAEERPYPLTKDKALLRETLDSLSATGIACIDVEVLRLTPEVEPEKHRAFLETGALLGATTVTVHLPDPEVARAVDKFGRLCAMARPLGLHLAIEFLPWTAMSTLAQAADVCKAVGTENCGVLIDTLHFHRSASTVAELASLPKAWLRVLHIADCPAATPTTAEGLMHTARRERLLPGEGAIDLAAILAVMPPDVPVTLEIPHEGRVAASGLENYSRRALATTRAFIDTLATGTRADVR